MKIINYPTPNFLGTSQEDQRVYQCRNCGNSTILSERIIPYCGWCYKPDMVERGNEWIDGVLFVDDEVPA